MNTRYGEEDFHPRRGANQGFWTPKRVLYAIAGLVVLIFGFASCSGLIETVDAGEIVVKQSWVNGELTVFKDAGPKWQGWGKMTHYRVSQQYWFSSKDDQGNDKDRSIKLSFNDGGHANLSGSVRYDLPQDDAHIILLHRRFGSQEAIDQALIRTVMEKAVYFSGPLMSSTQSYAERRNELIGFIEDQAIHGIYKSSSHCEKQPDPVTKQEKTVCMVEIDKDPKGVLVRVESSPLEEYGIKLSNLSVNSVAYDKAVDSQIAAQQHAITDVQTAAAEARKAEQRAITAAKEGEANAAKAKWEQEVIKAKAVTEAEQQKEVARLSKETAEFKKQEQILLGEGEAARKKAVMTADGALDKKLAAWVQVNTAYATELGKQRLVPEVMFGGNAANGNAAGNATQLVEMLTANTARQLALDLKVAGK